MPARTAENNDQRWRVINNNLVDASATTAGWDLADEMVRLKIAEVSANTPEDIVPVRTPPKSKIIVANVAQRNTESPLDAISSSSSPESSERQISSSHSRGSSIDSASSHGPVVNKRLNPDIPAIIQGVALNIEAKERPRSFSGSLSNADLRRLSQVGSDEQQHWVQPAEQLSYPSLAHNHVHRPQPLQAPSAYDIRNTQHQLERDEEYSQQREYGLPVPHPSYIPGANGVQPMGYRQSPRVFQQGMVPGGGPHPYAGHTPHLSLGNTQQLYDMMLPGAGHDNHPALNRVQQQHGVFRATHHHSASDPSSLRDAAALAVLNSNMQFAPGMFAPPPGMLYANGYYGAQDVTQLMAGRVQPQYTGPYNMPAPPLTQQPQANPDASQSISPTSTGGGLGPSSNNRKLGLYKTELCRSWEEKGSCRYGTKCQFAHGEDELRRVQRHPKYKTEICRTFWVSGSCPYGKRCCFIHTELPTSAATPPGVPSATESTTSSQPDGRARSMSTNSDPNEGSTTSILARIKNNNGGNSNSSGSVSASIEATPTNGNTNGSSFQFNARPPTGSLRVDTSVLDGTSVKQQNKSAYPSFASNGIMLPAPESIRPKSPAPVTAGPDLGRYNAAARREIVGYNVRHIPSSFRLCRKLIDPIPSSDHYHDTQQQQGPKKGHASHSNPRHSFSGELDLSYPSPPPTGGSHGLNSADHNNATTPTTGSSIGSASSRHVRGGSAGNWSSLVRSNLVNSAFPHGSSPAGDSPWSSNDIAVSANRLHEKTWA
ncbi:hypothetical protein FA15DRAFT_488679 [Coprinopsis marcescibilis]|uniref:C3H1-type domain-containing protein n=1 Tax=Coprinopsis marcescibilis TaxID=230819 RepID=A0A5C3KRA6_COPMA|nr:hypothetical protein FA15DRAFT_488679 [Coprinopsis marcescibilis]